MLTNFHAFQTSFAQLRLNDADMFVEKNIHLADNTRRANLNTLPAGPAGMSFQPDKFSPVTPCLRAVNSHPFLLPVHENAGLSAGIFSLPGIP
jgi:hypothetical protein